MNNPAPGWYPDPNNPAAQRWWDGQQWAPPSAPPAPAATPAPGMQPAAVGRTTAPKKSIWKNKWLWIVIGAVVLLGIIINLVNPTPKVAVPDVAGMTAIEAIETIESAGFRAQLKNEADDRTVSNGADFDAVGTDPTAGSEAPEGDRITIIVTEATERLEAEAAERERIAAEEEAAKEAEREAARAESEARGAERASAIENELKTQFGIQEFSELLVQDPSLWGGYINGIRAEGNDIYITLQLIEEGPDDDIGQRAATAITKILPDTVLEGVSWIIVEDAAGVVIGQEMVR